MAAPLPYSIPNPPWYYSQPDTSVIKGWRETMSIDPTTGLASGARQDYTPPPVPDPTSTPTNQLDKAYSDVVKASTAKKEYLPGGVIYV